MHTKHTKLGHSAYTALNNKDNLHIKHEMLHTLQSPKPEPENSARAVPRVLGGHNLTDVVAEPAGSPAPPSHRDCTVMTPRRIREEGLKRDTPRTPDPGRETRS